MFRWFAVSFLFIAACAPVPTGPPERSEPDATRGAPEARIAAQNFVTVVERMEPIAERICRARTQGVDCDYQVVVDDNVNAPPNAFQTVDRRGRPIIAFTVALIADARNQDELAFVFGHEAAHHIRGHLPQTRQNAVAGALLAGVAATLAGGNASDIRAAQNIGAQVGARTYSKEFELEADALGTEIAFRAGYDPAVGVAYFSRIPDPGNQFLGTHPPNADRIDIVRSTLAGLR